MQEKEIPRIAGIYYVICYFRNMSQKRHGKFYKKVKSGA